MKDLLRKLGNLQKTRVFKGSHGNLRFWKSLKRHFKISDKIDKDTIKTYHFLEF